MGVIEDSFKKNGNMMDGIPHVIIGGNKDEKRDVSSFKAWKGQNNQQPQYRDPIDVKIEKAKKYGLMFVVTFIFLYASYRILKVFF